MKSLQVLLSCGEEFDPSMILMYWWLIHQVPPGYQSINFNSQLNHILLLKPGRLFFRGNWKNIVLIFYTSKQGIFRWSSTGFAIVVLTPYGATVLIRILSFAHSQAKFFVSWLIAAVLVTNWQFKLWPANSTLSFSTDTFTFRCCIDRNRRQGYNTRDWWNEYDGSIPGCL